MDRMPPAYVNPTDTLTARELQSIADTQVSVYPDSTARDAGLSAYPDHTIATSAAVIPAFIFDASGQVISVNWRGQVLTINGVASTLITVRAAGLQVRFQRGEPAPAVDPLAVLRVHAVDRPEERLELPRSGSLSADQPGRYGVRATPTSTRRAC